MLQVRNNIVVSPKSCYEKVTNISNATESRDHIVYCQTQKTVNT